MHSGPVTLDVVPWDDADATRLRLDQQAELAALYDGEGDLVQELPPEEMLATVLLRTGDGTPVACGAVRDAAGYGAGHGELKRLYVRPDHRGLGLARRVLAELERLAADAGLTRLILETGDLQVAAIALYRSAGYRRIPNYGPYLAEIDSVCYARWLPAGVTTRAVVVTGMYGSGATATAAALSRLLREEALPHAWVVADALGQVWPRPPEDPYATDLVFEGLARLAPGYAARGYRHLVLARVVADEADQQRYEAALDGADVTMVDLDTFGEGSDVPAAEEAAARILEDLGWTTT